MKTTTTLLAALVAAISVHAQPPSVRTGSVIMSQGESGGQVVIDYVLENASAIVTVDVLTNGVSIGASHLTHFAGDVNRVVQPGARRMTWRPDKSWPGHEITDGSVKARVTAWALNAPPNYMVVDLVCDNDLRFYADAESLPEGGVTNDLYKTDKMVFRKCPAANVLWRMGAPSTELGYNSTRQIAHNVMLTNDFYIGIYELTQRQYERITGKTSCAYYTNPDYYATRPMENLTWAKMRMSDVDGKTDDNYAWPSKGHAVASTAVLGKLRAKVNQRVVFDLPVEAQWEFACRAGSGTGLYTGKEITKTTGACPNVGEIARYKYNSNFNGTDPAASSTTEYGTAPVGSYAPNDWGIYDMCGNVIEFCLDYYLADTSNVDPEIGSTTMVGSRVRRGGSYDSETSGCRSACRIEYSSETAVGKSTGFRIAAVAEIAE